MPNSGPRVPVAKTYHGFAVSHLETLIDRLELAAEPSQDATALESLHPQILSGCRKLYESGDYAEAVEKSFKIVRDRLRDLTGHETGSEAFGKAKLHIDGSAAPHVDADFQQAVTFLTMAIDFFRNEKSHTADGNISDPLRAYEYLRLSSLAMHLWTAVKFLPRRVLSPSIYFGRRLVYGCQGWRGRWAQTRAVAAWIASAARRRTFPDRLHEVVKQPIQGFGVRRSSRSLRATAFYRHSDGRRR
jgi:uncharacterized protein (TIGR02391 family)